MKETGVRRVPVILYHRIGTPPQGVRNPRSWVSVERFSWQMRCLAKWGFQTITTGQLAAHYRGEMEAGPRSVLITFDDGSRSCYTRAYPVMRPLGFTATVFIVGSHIGGQATWDRNPLRSEEDLLSLEEIRELIREGWEIGAHSMTHGRFTQLPMEVVDREIRSSKTHLDKIFSTSVGSFCYPYGSYAPAHTQVVQSAGFELGFTTHYPEHGLFAIRRENIHGEVNALRFLWRFHRAGRGYFRHVEP